MTTAINANIETLVTEISKKTFRQFSSGLGIMFDLDIKHNPVEVSTATLDALGKTFTTLSAAYSIQAKGSLSGTFYLVLDQKGVFTLPGIIVMHPEKRIKENCTKGTIEEAQPILDAVQELGNMFTGVFGQIARDKFQDSTDTVQTGTELGVLKDIPADFFNVAKDEEFCYASCEIIVGAHDPFLCGLIMPNSVFEK